MRRKDFGLWQKLKTYGIAKLVPPEGITYTWGDWGGGVRKAQNREASVGYRGTDADRTWTDPFPPGVRLGEGPGNEE